MNEFNKIVPRKIALNPIQKETAQIDNSNIKT
jgi:hypothetical protein